jgi:heme/copper-type cytochrome/quinol oxidase subunit 2
MVDVSFLVVLGFGLALIGVAAWFTYQNRKLLNEMCVMMSGMTFGMIPGFFLGAMFGLASGDFLIGSVVGVLAGTAIGVPMGQVGGTLARMEGVMAGPMGGIMGGMTGVMMRFYDVHLFVPFLVAVVGFTMVETLRMVQKSAEEACCGPESHAVHPPTVTRNEITLLAALAIAAVVFSYLFAYNPEPVTGPATAGGFWLSLQTNRTADAVVNGTAIRADGAQQVTIRMKPLGYTPDVVTVKRGVPVRLTLEADSSAGCTRSFVMADFGVRTVVPRGGSQTVQFTPEREGDFPFRCSMSMAGGTLRVVA